MFCIKTNSAALREEYLTVLLFFFTTFITPIGGYREVKLKIFIANFVALW